MEIIAIIYYKREFLRNWFIDNKKEFDDFDRLGELFGNIVNRTKTKRVILINDINRVRGFRVDKLYITPDAPHNPKYDDIIRTVKPSMTINCQ
jgi:hypothetical protein